MYRRLATWCFSHGAWVVAAWIAVLAGTNVAAGAVGSAFSAEFTIPASESARGLEILSESFPGAGGAFGGSIVVKSDGPVDRPEVRGPLEALFARVDEIEGVGVVSPFGPIGAAQVAPDGTIAFAENPPKKYQDIYPLNFDNDPEGLYAEVVRIVRLWMDRGVRIFRVDNPHTKPLWVWARLIPEIRETDPDVIFLAEAFTRPPMMRALAEVGFQQSYTYFTWRNDKEGLQDYFAELAGPASAYMRPNVFVNTPDILTEYLQQGGPAAFAIRATLAATLSPTWGVYSGFELFEDVALRPGSEEYLDSEKFEYRPRDWARAEATGRTLIPYITQLNAIRRELSPLQDLRSLRFHHAESDQVIAFSKRVGEDLVLVACTLDPYFTQETTIWWDMPSLGMDWTDRFSARDHSTGETWTWGQGTYVRLVPENGVAHVVEVRRP